MTRKAICREMLVYTQRWSNPSPLVRQAMILITKLCSQSIDHLSIFFTLSPLSISLGVAGESWTFVEGGRERARGAKLCFNLGQSSSKINSPLLCHSVVHNLLVYVVFSSSNLTHLAKMYRVGVLNHHFRKKNALSLAIIILSSWAS